jgi:hypothetical protein
LFLLVVVAVIATIACLGASPRYAASATDEPAKKPGWWIECDYRKSAEFDPIVFPGQPPPVGHMHSFEGGDARPTTTFSTLRSSDTTCTQPTGLPKAHRSAVWQPQAYQNAQMLQATDISIYYRPGLVDPQAVKPFPKGLRMIAGDAHAMTAQPNIRWGCGGGTTGPDPGNQMYSAPVDCPNAGDPQVKADVTFRQCVWKIDSADHQSHVTSPLIKEGNPYRVCPSGSTPVPRLNITVRYATSDGDGITLSSGDPNTMHMDYFEAWRKADMQTLIDRCMASSCNAKGEIIP